MIKKINKKAVFYSLSVVLFLVFLLIVFNTKADIQKRDDRFHLNRAQMIVMDHFVRDFDRYYIEAILETSARPALVELTTTGSGVFNGADLVNTMTGSSGNLDPLLTTDENFQQALNTLSFPVNDRDFSFSVQSIQQLNYYRIRINFLVDYRFGITGSEWSEDDRPISVVLEVYGFGHPAYDGIIDSSWIEDEMTTIPSYADQIFTGSTSGSENIKPVIEDNKSKE